MRVEIRCCCHPDKLLGTVEVGEGMRGHSTVFQLTSPPSKRAKLTDPVDSVVLDWGFVSTGVFVRPYPALKSMHLPIETLRRIPSFVEAK